MWWLLNAPSIKYTTNVWELSSLLEKLSHSNDSDRLQIKQTRPHSFLHDLQYFYYQNRKLSEFHSDSDTGNIQTVHNILSSCLKHTHTENNTDINVINNDKKGKLKGFKFDFRSSIHSLSFVFRES